MIPMRARCRAASQVALIACLVVPGLPSFVPRADAAVLCQVPKKPAVHLRATACKKKEQSVFDSTSQSARDAAQDSGIAALQGASGKTCIDPSRQLLTVQSDVTTLLMSMGYVSLSLCRTLDDDPARCATSFEPSYYGASACAMVAGKCLACDIVLDASGLCQNTCQPAVTCPADVTRTTRTLDCGQFATQAACEHAWTLSFDYAVPTDKLRATPCWWDAGTCKSCRADDMATGSCVNSCIAAADMPRCRIAGRSFGRCSALDTNPAVCGHTYEIGPYGTQTCWYDAGPPAKCEGCDPISEQAGKCNNGC